MYLYIYHNKERLISLQFFDDFVDWDKLPVRISTEIKSDTRTHELRSAQSKIKLVSLSRTSIFVEKSRDKEEYTELFVAHRVEFCKNTVEKT